MTREKLRKIFEKENKEYYIDKFSNYYMKQKDGTGEYRHLQDHVALRLVTLEYIGLLVRTRDERNVIKSV